MSRFLLRYGLVLTAAWLLLMVAARALGGSVGGQDQILTLSISGPPRPAPLLTLIDIQYKLPTPLSGEWVDGFPDVTADGRYLVYEVFTDDGWKACEVRDLYQNARLTHRTQSVLDCHINWSSQQTHIMFLLIGVDQWTVETFDFTTHNSHQITLNPLGDRTAQVIGDFNGSIISLVNRTASRESEIVQIDTDTGKSWNTGIVGAFTGEYPSDDGWWVVVPFFSAGNTWFHLLDTTTGTWTTFDSSPGEEFVEYGWKGSKFIYQRKEPNGIVTYRDYDPVTQQRRILVSGFGGGISLSEDGQHLVLVDNSLEVLRWNESDHEWTIIYQQPTPPVYSYWLDRQTLVIAQPNQLQTGASLLLFDPITQSLSKVNEPAGTRDLRFWLWEGNDDFILLTVEDSLGRESLHVVGRDGNLLRKIVPDYDELMFDDAEDSSSLVFVGHDYLGSSYRAYLVDTQDLSTQIFDSPGLMLNTVRLRQTAHQPNLAFMLMTVQGNDLYLLDTELNEVTPLLITPDVAEYTVFWVYPAPP